MDFRELLNVANCNSHEAKHESSIKTYSTVLPPPKKTGKSTVQSEGIKKFLAKRKAEEEAKAAAAQKQKEKLLELRSQNSKNNKKAKLMAARTKDNDFSKIKLSEDELAAKKKIEQELNRKHLKDKKERMKARIELEEKEAMLPKKRKRKSKQGGEEQSHESDEHVEEESLKKDKNHSSKNGARKSLPPPVNFAELLKMAETKMHEPVIIPKKKEEERLMTKKEKRIYEEEQARLKRKQELLQKGIQPSLNNRPPMGKKENDRMLTKKPHVVHIEKNKASSQISDSSSKFKIPKSFNNVDSVEKIKTNDSFYKNHDKSVVNSVKKLKPGDRLQSSKKDSSIVSKPFVPESSITKKASKVKPVTTSKVPSIPTIDSEAIAADIERRLREKLEQKYAENLKKQLAEDLEKKIQAKVEKELEEKYRLSLEEQRRKLNLHNEPVQKVKKLDIVSKSTPINGKVPLKSMSDKPLIKKNIEKPTVTKNGPTVQKNSAPKLPPKKTFHANPYLDPPRRLLEPIIPPKKRRIIEDDDDDEEDSDMDSFIDDGPSVDDENYSQYIKQIFGYDRNKYVDDDDDDIMESSYCEQMKEEMRSTRLGYMEDLEEERKLREEEKARKLRLMKKKK